MWYNFIIIIERGFFMRNKRLAVLLLALVIVFGTFSTVLASQFADANNSWAANHIDWAIAQGIVQGYPDGTFKPTNTITRAEYCTMLNRMIGTTNAAKKIYFTDVYPTSWYYNDIAYALGYGYLPQTNGCMYPEGYITRDDAAQMLASAFGLKSDVTMASKFTDSAKIVNKGAVGALINAGVIQGYQDNTFRPGNYLQRDEVTKMFHVAYVMFSPNYTGVRDYTTVVNSTNNPFYNPYEGQTVYPTVNYTPNTIYTGYEYYNSDVNKLANAVEDGEDYLANSSRYTAASIDNLRRAVNNGKDMLSTIRSYAYPRGYEDYYRFYYNNYGYYPTDYNDRYSYDYWYNYYRDTDYNYWLEHYYNRDYNYWYNNGYYPFYGYGYEYYAGYTSIEINTRTNEIINAIRALKVR